MPCNAEQYRIINDFLNSPSQLTLIQGKAGSGKSYLIRELVSRINGAIILTPTNMAKSVYNYAQTMHSFFYGEFDDLENGFQNPKEYSVERNLNHNSFIQKLRPIHTIIIDEVSMVRADTFEMMNVICQSARGNSAPFGGIKVILVGDLFQLSPIVEDEETGRYLKDEYGGYYFFDSHVIKKHLADIRYYELQHSERHNQDPDYERILDSLRRGCPVSTAIQMLDKLNSRVVPESAIPPNVIAIASSNAEVLRINHQELAKLPGQEHRECAVFTIKKRDDNTYTTYVIGQEQPPENVYNTIEVPSKYESDFRFKVGAHVMFTESKKKAGYVNGDFGIVLARDANGILVRTDKTGSTVLIERTEHYRYKMKYDEVKHDLAKVTPYIQKTKQFPLKLGYAFTIHKAQGQTYNQVVLDLHSHIFASGQLYVALSRVKSLNGLYLTKPVTISDIIIDQEVISFLGRFDGSTAIMPTCINTSRAETISHTRETITRKESLDSISYYVGKSLRLAEELYTLECYSYAMLEIQKSLVVLEEYYNTEQYSQIVSQIHRLGESFPNNTQEDCVLAANRLEELFLDICGNGHNMVINDKR